MHDMHERRLGARAYRLSILRAITLPSFILLRAVNLFMLERIGEYYTCSDSFANIYCFTEGDASHTVRRHYSHAAHGVCALQSSSFIHLAFTKGKTTEISICVILWRPGNAQLHL